MPRIDEYLALGRKGCASDVHLNTGRPPLLRIDGELQPVRAEPLAPGAIEALFDEVMTEDWRARFTRNGSVDFSYEAAGLGRFRVNYCRQARGVTAVCRVVPDRVFPLSELGLPKVIESVTSLKSGLVLVTGATGTGKSTTLAALIDRINETRYCTIITLEDPIEFLHASKSALVLQREVGVHIDSYADGLRSVLRQDPDVILVGELRDRESMALALEASETGHLVLGTLHTRGAAATIDRILDSFPAEAHNQIRHTLADNLKCVISQELVRSADGRGRRAALEILVAMPAVAQLIREGETFKIPTAITTGRKYGMQLMDHALLSLVRAGDVDADEAYRLAVEKREFVPFLTRPDPMASSQASALAYSGTPS
jgi:twitching motility protein PilT